MTTPCVPIVFRDKFGDLWAYYQKVNCLDCNRVTAHLIDSYGFVLKCAECRVLTHVETENPDHYLVCENCVRPVSELYELGDAWVCGPCALYFAGEELGV
jgi:hypothetical protein